MLLFDGETVWKRIYTARGVGELSIHQEKIRHEDAWRRYSYVLALYTISLMSSRLKNSEDLPPASEDVDLVSEQADSRVCLPKMA